MATTNTTPALEPPPGTKSNFIDPPTLMPAIIAGTIVIHLFTAVFILTRISANVISKEVRIEDYLSYLAYCGYITYTVTIVHTESLGLARHMWDVPLAGFANMSFWCNVVFICYTASGGLAKTVVFLQLKRFFTTLFRGAVFWVIVGSLIANAGFYLAMFFLYIFTCWPREKIWDPTVEGHCIDSNKLNLAMGILNFISDAEALLVPTWAIWQLQMDLRQKIGVFAVFGVGVFAVAIAAVGLYYRIVLLQQPDFTWLLTKAGLTCMAELAIVIIVGCCPSVPRVLGYFKAQNSTHDGYDYDKRHSIPSRPASRLNPFNKYLTSDIGMSKLDSRASEEHVELHDYQEERWKEELGGCNSVSHE
ncbi:hypothetical protein P153DRAFT_298969 [Dothidotthia symphoricarpi CBS 119687]|uniref:Rhodopsin domain-containing protein n=1 Tax=Dothidotthia symphoricarpi CBS 119687 TaxID=1392245 RepID=A0A6A6A292_9PLEO|nr:uncharacterized protein P153DRAFT_298969 [Dothidotthia symphoricarpi CBS 119687]KAF2125656.1 hypothetical protein P153DRAFT_298969 [Dothidotthia symphoricarpi CBS 119687]